MPTIIPDSAAVTKNRFSTFSSTLMNQQCLLARQGLSLHRSMTYTP